MRYVGSLFTILALSFSLSSLSCASPDIDTVQEEPTVGESEQAAKIKAVSGISRGTLVVNGQTYYLESQINKNIQGEINGWIKESLTYPAKGQQLIPPGHWWVNIIVKAHTIGCGPEPILATQGDMASVRIDLGPYGILDETMMVLNEHPLVYGHWFTGKMQIPDGEVLLPWVKDMNFSWMPDGTATGSVVLKAVVVEQGVATEKIVPVQYTINYQGQPISQLPLTVQNHVQITSYDPQTGAFTGHQSTTVLP